MDKTIHDLQQQIADLKKGVEQSAGMISNIPGIVYRCLCDKDWTCEFMSEKVETLTGYPASDFIQNEVRSFAGIIHPEDRQMVEDAVFDAVNRDRPYTIEYRILHRDGSIRWVYENGSAEKDVNNKVLWLNGVVFDVTVRKAAQENLQQNQERYEALFENMSNAVAIFEAADDGNDFIIVNFNTSAEKAENITRENIIGRSVQQAFPGVKEFGLFEVFQRVWRTGVPEQFPMGKYRDDRISGWRDNFVYKLPTGEIVAIYSDETLRKQAEENIKIANRKLKAKEKELLAINQQLMASEQQMLAANQELIESNQQLLRSEEALRESEERLKFAIEGSGDGIWEWNSASSDTVSSIRCREMLGFGESELGNSLTEWEKLINPNDSELVKRILKDVVEGTIEYFRIESRMKCKDGSWKWIVSRGKVINRTDDGKPSRMLGTQTDITQRKTIENSLRQAQKVEALGTLAGGIAHDFNNILAGIMGYTEMTLLELSEGSPIKTNMEQVLQSTIRASELVKQILTFSRQTEQEKRPLKIKLLLNEALKLLRATIPTTIDIKPCWDTDGNIFADPTQIHQIVMNLCTNAIQAMPEKGLLKLMLSEVFIDEKTASGFTNINPGSYVKLTVSDTGDGIPAEILNRIFDPYFTTKELGKGTGMGLAVVQGIIKAHSGMINVYSEPGKGTTFSVYLPKIDEEIKDKMRTIEPLPTGSERIMFVDDDEVLIDMTKKIITSLGYTVNAQKNSREALDSFRKNPDAFDLVITDYTMPHMTGYELSKDILRIRPDIPIILCTGFSEAISSEQAKEAGIREFIMKPIDRRNMAEIIRKVLDQKNDLHNNGYP